MPSHLVSFCLVAGMLTFVAACDRRSEFIAPKEAEFAVSVAKNYAMTNGWEQPTLRDAKIRDGVWTIELLSKNSRSHLDYVAVHVSSNGQVTWYSAPR